MKLPLCRHWISLHLSLMIRTCSAKLPQPNSLSDIYAMGGKPITVMNIVGFPISKLDKSILADILAGASDKVKESGAVLVGGTPLTTRSQNSAYLLLEPYILNG